MKLSGRAIECRECHVRYKPYILCIQYKQYMQYIQFHMKYMQAHTTGLMSFLAVDSQGERRRPSGAVVVGDGVDVVPELVLAPPGDAPSSAGCCCGCCGVGNMHSTACR